VRIVVLMGGDSPEREISLASGRAVAEALAGRGHEVRQVVLETFAEAVTSPQLEGADLIFPALHGGAGEDGRLQAVLEMRGLPYALSGPLAGAVAMRKSTAKRLMRGAGIPTPDWLLVQARGRLAGMPDGPAEGDAEAPLSLDHVRRRAAAELGFPLVIKPDADGSSVGVAIVKSAVDFDAAYAAAAEGGRDVLIERYVPGRELTAAIFLGRRLPLLEIRPRSGFYDYGNKYTEGASEYLVPAPVHSPVYERISDDALRLYDLLGCRGLARVDFRLDGDTYSCLEINTIPGMTATSLVPKAAAAVGIGFAEMLEDVCLDALAPRGIAGGKEDGA